MSEYPKHPSTLQLLIKDKLEEHARNQNQNPDPRSYQEGGAHYKSLPIEPWDIIDTWPINQQIGYHRGNILKYTMRLGIKDEELKEAKKIRHYADKLIEVLEKKY